MHRSDENRRSFPIVHLGVDAIQVKKYSMVDGKCITDNNGLFPTKGVCEYVMSKALESDIPAGFVQTRPKVLKIGKQPQPVDQDQNGQQRPKNVKVIEFYYTIS
uniref:Uncharacterized protein n=1 Tax=Romanomermis culicivorax TaxID=13658 RepID=A0A915HVF6_ROMCU